MSMKLVEFVYSDKPRKVYVMREPAGFIEGIDFSGLTEAEAAQLKAILDKYSEDLQPFMKQYRRFSVQKISWPGQPNPRID